MSNVVSIDPETCKVSDITLYTVVLGFLNRLVYFIQDCMYLHEMGDDSACFTKEDMQQG